MLIVFRPGSKTNPTASSSIADAAATRPSVRAGTSAVPQNTNPVIASLSVFDVNSEFLHNGEFLQVCIRDYLLYLSSNSRLW